MIHRPFRSFISGALTLAFVVAPTFISLAQTATAPDASTNAAATATAPVAAPAAAPAPADTTAAPAASSSDRPTSYTMVAGDSLASIAKKFDTSIHELAKLNKIPKSKYHKLKIGTVLQIPPAKADATSK
jgi:LysM repeat protein